MKFTPERFVLVALVVAVAVLGYLYFQRPAQVVRNETRYIPTMRDDSGDQWFRDREVERERSAMNERIDCLARRSASRDGNLGLFPC